MPTDTVEHPTSANAQVVPARGPMTSGSGKAITQMRRYAQMSNLPFACVDRATGQLKSSVFDGFLPISFDAVLESMGAGAVPSVASLPSGLIRYAVPLNDCDDAWVAAVGYALDRPGIRPQELVIAASRLGWSEAQLTHHLEQLPHCGPNQLLALLRVVHSQVQEDTLAARLSEEMDLLCVQLDHTYEEISLLHSLTRNLQISRSPLDLAELCLDRMRGLIRSGGNAVWIEDRFDEGAFLVSGEIPFSGVEAFRRLVGRFEQHDWARPLVRNHVSSTLLGADFPGLESLILVPLQEGTHRAGWLMSCNVAQGFEFGTVEASLLNSIATILGTHLRNIDLYQQHEDLMVSVVRSMVSTLDAKDPYTRGHSERVAMIARCLGEQLNLPEEDLDDIYLSGVLHDIGKVGIDDRILRKPGRLEEDEFRQIQKHPVIGYEILRGIKNLQKVLPGVRNHHEQMDGRGYPDGLVGDEIPLMARILAVADSYDAMTSDRPYRRGLPLDRVEQIFRDGSGTQWDSRVIDAYFQIRHRVKAICDAYRPEKLIELG